LTKIRVAVTGKDRDGNEFEEAFIIDGSISSLTNNDDFNKTMKRISDKYGNDRLDYTAFKHEDQDIFKV
jgi:hypothetical protein